MKVLIVDDNELMRFTIRALLTEMGHEVVGEAADGERALKAFSALKPEVVFLASQEKNDIISAANFIL